MKKMFFLLMCFCMVLTNANSQVCKISGDNDNVEIFSCSLANNDTEIHVVVANDSQSISANVTITVKVDYGPGGTQTYTGRKIAQPNQETLIVIKNIPHKQKGYPIKSVEAIGISGAKCM